MSTELSNGVIIPEEYSDDWYDEMSINLRKLNDVITAASDNATDITALQTAVSTAQATANSAQQTATTARQQSYVFRYSSTALTASSTNSNTLLDNTDNLKVGDKVIDSSGVLFSITAIDTQNSTFTIGTALIDLAQDSDVVHKSRDETVAGNKTFTNTIKSKKEIELSGNRLAYILPNFSAGYSGLSLCTYDANGAIKIGTWKVDDNDNTKHVLNDSLGYLNVSTGSSNSVNIVYLTPKNATDSKLGDSTNKWKTINGINPGALSLPNGNAQDTSWIGDLTVKDGSNYNLKTFTLNGWVTINIPNTAGNLVVVNNGCGQIVTNEANGITGNNCAVFIPVVANVQISILLVLQTGESVKTAIFAPCLGNV